jgi:hypothetical protein
MRKTVETLALSALVAAAVAWGTAAISVIGLPLGPKW